MRKIDESHRAVINELKIKGAASLRSSYPVDGETWKVETYKEGSKAFDSVVVARFLEMMYESGQPEIWPDIVHVEKVAEYLIGFRGLEDVGGHMPFER